MLRMQFFSCLGFPYTFHGLFQSFHFWCDYSWCFFTKSAKIILFSSANIKKIMRCLKPREKSGFPHNRSQGLKGLRLYLPVFTIRWNAERAFFFTSHDVRVSKVPGVSDCCLFLSIDMWLFHNISRGVWHKLQNNRKKYYYYHYYYYYYDDDFCRSTAH